MIEQDKAEMDQVIGHPFNEEASRRGLGFFVTAVVLVIVGIAVWLIVSSSDDTS